MGAETAAWLYASSRGRTPGIVSEVVRCAYSLFHPLAFRCSLDYLKASLGRFEAFTLDLLSCLSVPLVARVLCPGGEDLEHFSAGEYVTGFPLLIFLFSHGMVFWTKRDGVYLTLGRGAGMTASMSIFLLIEALVMLGSSCAIHHIFGIRGFFVILLSFSAKRLILSIAQHLSMARDGDLHERTFRREHAGGFLDTQIVRAFGHFLILSCLPSFGGGVSACLVLAFELFLVSLYVYTSVSHRSSWRGSPRDRGESETGPGVGSFLDDLLGGLIERRKGWRLHGRGSAPPEPPEAPRDRESPQATAWSPDEQYPEMQYAPHTTAILNSLTDQSFRKG